MCSGAVILRIPLMKRLEEGLAYTCRLIARVKGSAEPVMLKT